MTTDFTEGYANKDLTELKRQELAKVVAKKGGESRARQGTQGQSKPKEIRSRKSFDNDRNTYRIHLDCN